MLAVLLSAGFLIAPYFALKQEELRVKRKAYTVYRKPISGDVYVVREDGLCYLIENGRVSFVNNTCLVYTSARFALIRRGVAQVGLGPGSAKGYDAHVHRVGNQLLFTDLDRNEVPVTYVRARAQGL